MKQVLASCLKVMKEQKEKLQYLAILVHQTVKAFEQVTLTSMLTLKKNKLTVILDNICIINNYSVPVKSYPLKN